jgi:predicted DCC family thiol-disulfide oxidoreductase YuxK
MIPAASTAAAGERTTLLGRWEAYWLEPAPLVNLAAARILFLALFIWWYWIQRGDELVGYEGTDVYAPILITRLIHGLLGLPNPGPAAQQALFLGLLALALAGLVGWKTKAATLGAALLYTYLKAEQYSHGGYVHHPDAITAICLWVLALSPSGGALSVDDLLRRARRAARTGTLAAHADTRLHPYAGWPLRLVPLLLALIYLYAGLCKLWVGKGLAWANGTTLQFYMVQDGTELAMRLAQHPALVQLLSILIWLFELTFWIILVVPALVWLYAIGGVLFHVGSLVVQGIDFTAFLFAYVFLFDYRRIAARVAPPLRERLGPGPAVVYDGACPLCLRSMAALGYLDWFGRLRGFDLEDWDRVERSLPGLDRDACVREMHVVDPASGRVTAGFDAFRRLCRTLPPLWPLLPVLHLPGAGAAGSAAYRWVASRRARYHPGVCTRHSCG